MALFPKFIKYFYKNFFISFPLNKMIWLYDQYNFLLYEDVNLLFFTNNIVESCNRTLNNHYIGNIKSFQNFKNSINDLVEIYSKSKRKYISNEFSVTQALAYHIKITKITGLITYKELLKIYKEYIKYKKLKIELVNVEDLYSNIYT